MSDEQETVLADYILTCSKMNYPLTTKDSRRLAYETAVKNNVIIPEQWENEKMAGLEWLRNFMKRHSFLSIRHPEACSIARSSSFNRHNVETFMDKLKEVLERNPSFSDGSRLWNLDETGTTTVQKPRKVIAGKGVKSVAQATSGEKGSLVTTCCFINALGNTLPPAMVFPRTHFKSHMIRDGPSGTLGLATPSGWMNADLFVDVMKHFIKHTCSSKENPTLLLLDNHESHLSIECLDLAKENSVTILTFPPHCSHKLQPLDVGVYFSFKSHYNSAVSSWLVNHPGTPFTIYDIAGCVNVAFQRSMTKSNIGSGFRKTGIFPYDKNVFTDDDYLPSSVTDRPCEETLQTETNGENSRTESSQADDNKNSQLTGISLELPLEIDKDCNENSERDGQKVISPYAFRGLPKAEPRKTNRRKKGRCMIVTDTPEKNKLTELALKRRSTKQAINEGKSSKRRLFDSSLNSQNEGKRDFSCLSSSSSSDHEEDVMEFSPLTKEPSLGDYVLIEFHGKTKLMYYVSVVTKAKDRFGDIEVSFMRRVKNSNKFIFPEIPDMSSVSVADVKMILPEPNKFGATKRQNSYLSFEVKFGNINVK